MSHQKKNSLVRGLKGAIHNPNVSEEAKQRDLQRLQEMGEDITGLTGASSDFDAQDEGRSADPHIFLKLDQHEDAMKQVTKQMLEQGEEDMQRSASAASADLDIDMNGHSKTRVLAGYKATLSNPRTSKAAKAHAEQVLEEYA
ncbi:hypothetical protein DFP72DRAFT_906815 [Ephemerocybe angulata]|uniref:Conidiation-specific protein 6 n=1 Tax=Ephemerocybe angulata TaxID=980116 RepID=A0A8H6M496_9AGAR|nr:hypothetical protein DFP72DRAFT_906815 [Tulosesus angulatus]